MKRKWGGVAVVLSVLVSIAGCAQVSRLDFADGGGSDATADFSMPLDLTTSSDAAGSDLAFDAPADLGLDATSDGGNDLGLDAPADGGNDSSADAAGEAGSGCSADSDCSGWRPEDPRDTTCGLLRCLGGQCGIDPLTAVSCASGYACDYRRGSCVARAFEPSE